jgi:uncharacterized membrane protein
MPFLIAKLSLVALLLISVSFVVFTVSKAKKQRNQALLAKIRPLSMLNFALGLTIVVLAVLTFR